MWNKIPFVDKLPTDQANVNALKSEIKVPLAKIGKWLEKNKLFVYLVLGGKEGTFGKQGADIPTSLFTDEDVNPIFGWITEQLENLCLNLDYDETYLDYRRDCL